MTSASTSAIASTRPGTRRFPATFRWGSATSAYQIEGAVAADGRGESIWDRFCATPGAIADGSSGAEACDHYRRWADDIALMRDLGLQAYRFSIAWPRIVPDGVGAINQRGLDFYERLVDGLLAAGIEPAPTLYHWDLPQALQDRGGWTVRATAEAFADYASVVLERLGDRVPRWMTLNEPFVSANHGYVTGEHAPGIRDERAGLAAAHHLLVGHGLALGRIRDLAPTAQAGIVLNFTPVVPASDEPADVAAAELVDGVENRWYVEPLAGLGYPADTRERLGWDGGEILDGDLELIAGRIDALGVNFYSRSVASADREATDERAVPRTSMGWEIHPPSLGGLLRRLHEHYGFSRYVITENGAAMPDEERSDDGRVADHDRIRYVAAHLAEVHDAIGEGIPVEGYFVWSLLDNFEWAHGYGPRFGLVEVEPGSLRRVPKASAEWYREVCHTGVVADPL
ncbi:GH1 family beta-glucosidase [Desertimonas flava]|uniref:GH1 family beta-glucosidase n=1 Tax=Desertimonas flava TaxID=2064846 RepID=UPI000E352E99|nr:GH1 family beta-glucosidase [Desertimonas flava]